MRSAAAFQVFRRVLSHTTGSLNGLLSDHQQRYTMQYLTRVFGSQDHNFQALKLSCDQAGLPDISISSLEGKLLSMITKSVSAKVVVELGTLGGYSALWLASGLSHGGTVFTIEGQPERVRQARRHLEAAGVSASVEIIEGSVLEVLPALIDRISPKKVDVAFIDAQKSQYVQYFKELKPHMSQVLFSLMPYAPSLMLE